ncbi:protein MMS22-like [Diorhabda sublineata]|uniref:protein MMS22-like n=1 Tax=Diorhabda sublineata TaxID=1163346 RepID=UPI0024E1327B|nr:protein MMS22-like [Diorhabda sublineata]
MNGYLFSCEKNNDMCLYGDFRSYFENIHVQKQEVNMYIGNNVYHLEGIVEEIDVIIGLVQREWFLFQEIALHDVILNTEEIFYAREFINKALTGIKQSLQICNFPNRKDRYKKKVFEEIKCIVNSVIHVNRLHDDFVVKLSSWKDNDAKNPVYQYFHTFLEIQYYILFLNYICEPPDCVMDEFVEVIMNNFIQLSKKNYQRQTGKVFVCHCVKNFWLLLQFYLEKSKDGEQFWKIFNKLLEQEDSVFSLWILVEISKLHLKNESLLDEGNLCHRIRPNYDLLLNKLKNLLLDADSDMLLNVFKILTPLLTDYWLKHARIDVYQIIWDFYSKKLNISNKNYSNLSALEIKASMNNIISSPDECKEDFEIFLGILNCHLREYPSHWGKMKGRIYSQLGPHKLKELNHVGIVHVMFLFASLSNLNYEELLKKIVSFLEAISQEKRSDPLIWNVFTAFIFMQVQRGLSIEKTSPLLLTWIQEASLDNKKFHLIKTFITNFEHILNISIHMNLHQWILLNTWLIKYLSSCYYADMTNALEILLYTLGKVESPDSWSVWCSSFQNYVYPMLKQISPSHNAPGTVGIIAGKLYFLIPHLSLEIFNYFTNDNISSLISSHFLTIVLAEYPSSCILNNLQEASVIQCWMKICLLNTQSSKLTSIITKLDHFPTLLKSHINSSEDSLRGFIEYLGSDIKSHIQSNTINKLCELCFGSIDKWLPQYLNHPENESVVFRIYISLSLAFLHCGSLLYNRNRSSSPLTKLMHCLLFPSDFLLGKTPHEYVINSIKKTWHLFYEALVKLKSDSDVFLERSLRDLITKYIPYFPTTDSPIVKCLENDITAETVLEKICNCYFKHPVKERDNNLSKVIKILNDTIQSTTSVPLLKLLITKTLCGLFELVIFHPQRSLAINLIKTIIQSPLYPQVKLEFSTCVISTTEKHLNFNAINYFQLMYILAKFIPTDVKDVLKEIGQQVAIVERLRGVGYDINLRSQLEKLENAVNIT